MHLRFSHDIRALLERLATHPLTLSDVLAETSERGFVLVIALLALPFLLPTIPGFTTILGSAILLISVQMALGRRSLWLPRRVARFRFPKTLTQQLLNNLHRFSRWLEKIARPRWAGLAQHPSVWRINGICISWLTLLLMLPVPFTNSIFSLGILVFVIAMLEADGVLLCVAYALTGIITVAVGVIAYLLWQSPTLLPGI
ncbi:MAG: exopolysaccharide biosynthesis protein [Elainellaceae cyanobacterium]